MFVSTILFKSYSEDLITNFNLNLKNKIYDFEHVLDCLDNNKGLDNRLDTLSAKLKLARYKYSIESLIDFIETHADLLKMIDDNLNVCISEDKINIFNDSDAPSILLNIFNISFKYLDLDELKNLEIEYNIKNEDLLAENMKNKLSNYLKIELNKINKEKMN